MNRQVLVFIALAISIIFGLTVAVADDRSVIAPVGGGIVALAWIAVGVFGRDAESGRQRERVR